MAIINLAGFVKTTGKNYPIEADHISAVLPAIKPPGTEFAIKVYLLGGQTLDIDGFFNATDRDEILEKIFTLWKDHQS